MTTPTEQLARANELDKLRTQGEWSIASHAKGNVVCKKRIVAGCMGFQDNVDSEIAHNENIANAEYCAQAPAILQLANHFAEQLAIAREALKKISHILTDGKDEEIQQREIVDICLVTHKALAATDPNLEK